MTFNTVYEVIDWLAPMDYETFWAEIRPYCLVLIPREDCDADIAAGLVDEAVVLEILKSMARLRLTTIFRLDWIDEDDIMALH